MSFRAGDLKRKQCHFRTNFRTGRARNNLALYCLAGVRKNRGG